VRVEIGVKITQGGNKGDACGGSLARLRHDGDLERVRDYSENTQSRSLEAASPRFYIGNRRGTDNVPPIMMKFPSLPRSARIRGSVKHAPAVCRTPARLSRSRNRRFFGAKPALSAFGRFSVREREREARHNASRKAENSHSRARLHFPSRVMLRHVIRGVNERSATDGDGVREREREREREGEKVRGGGRGGDSVREATHKSV